MNPEEIDPIVNTLPESWQPWARLVVELSVIASFLTAAMKRAGFHNWITRVLDLLAANSAPTSSVRKSGRIPPSLTLMSVALACLGCGHGAIVKDAVQSAAAECAPNESEAAKEVVSVLTSDGVVGFDGSTPELAKISDDGERRLRNLANRLGTEAVSCIVERAMREALEKTKPEASLDQPDYGDAIARWLPEDRPVHVLASSSMPVECKNGLTHSLNVLHGFAPYLDLVPVPHDHPAALGIAPSGSIGVSYGELNPGETERTYVQRRGPRMLSADIVLADCDPRSAAHGIGHALGLPDTDDEWTLMCRSRECFGWLPSAVHAAWIQ